MLLEVERLSNVALHYEALKKLLESGEKKEGWEITEAICTYIEREIDILS